MVDNNKTIVEAGKYHLTSNFEQKNKGYSFGTGRDQNKFQNYLKMLAETPASNKYTIDDSSSK